MNKKGILISFEGGEGSGKSTQAKMLAAYLNQNNIFTILTREPGGTETAEKIRHLLVTGAENSMDRFSEVLLHCAARNEHIKKVVLPALHEKKFVVTDRFFDSTYAYQGYGHGVDRNIIKRVHDDFMEGLEPDITFIFDIEAKKGLARSGRRHADEDSSEDRYERIGLPFHKRLREGFLEIAKNNPHRCIIMNAEETIETLHKKVITELHNRGII